MISEPGVPEQRWGAHSVSGYLSSDRALTRPDSMHSHKRYRCMIRIGAAADLRREFFLLGLRRLISKPENPGFLSLTLVAAHQHIQAHQATPQQSSALPTNTGRPSRAQYHERSDSIEPLVHVLYEGSNALNAGRILQVPTGTAVDRILQLAR